MRFNKSQAIDVSQSKEVCIQLLNCTIASHNIMREYDASWKYVVEFYFEKAHMTYNVGITRSLRDVFKQDIQNGLETKYIDIYLCLTTVSTKDGEKFSKLMLSAYRIGKEYMVEGTTRIAENLNPNNIIVQGPVIAQNIKSINPHTNNNVVSFSTKDQIDMSIKDLEQIEVYNEPYEVVENTGEVVDEIKTIKITKRKGRKNNGIKT